MNTLAYEGGSGPGLDVAISRGASPGERAGDAFPKNKVRHLLTTPINFHCQPKELKTVKEWKILQRNVSWQNYCRS